MSTKSSASSENKGRDEKQEATKQPGKDDVHEQREPEQEQEGVVSDVPESGHGQASKR